MIQLKKEVFFCNLKQFAKKIAQEAMDIVIQKKAFSQGQAPNWINQICDKIVSKLKENNGNFKYIVNCLIMQRKDCELCSVGSYYWDNELDSSVIVQKDYNQLSGMVTIFGIAY